MNVCNPLYFSFLKKKGVGGITQINMLHGNSYLANCGEFVPMFAVLLASGAVSQKLWDHCGAELSSRKYSKVAGPVAAG